MRPVVAFLAGLLLTLTGCVQIPTAGPVEEVPLAEQPRGIDIAPEPPSPDMTPERLVEGYLQAMADPDGGYAIARQYLTLEAAADWDPVDAVIFDGEVAADGSSARLVGLAIGRLDHRGRYTPDRAALDFDFGLVEEQGGWRIGEPPDGLLLTRFNFERYYSRVNLYFVSRVGSHVVPDPVHIPESLVTPANVLDELFEGPSDRISRAVRDAVPAGTRLGPGGATIDQAGVVTIHLAGMSTNLDDDALRWLGAQLLWSLTSVPRFTGLSIFSGGRALPIPGSSANGVLELATQQGYQVLSRAAATDLFGVGFGRVGRIGGEKAFQAIAGIPERAADLAVSVDGASIALINEERTALSLGGLDGPVERVELPLTNLRSPQFVLGTLWVMGDDRFGGSRLATVDRNGLARMVNTEWTTGRMHDFAVSPSRARVAIVADHEGAATLGIAEVLGADPITVTAWEPLQVVAPSGELLTLPSSPAWQAETSLALLASDGGTPSVFVTMLDGAVVQDLGAVTGDITDVTANVRLGGGPVALTTEQGAAWRFEPRNRWSRAADGISAVAYPG